MFRLNRLTDYAIVVMGQMDSHPDEVLNAAEIARGTGVPAPTVAKLMTTLAHVGLVSSQRGVAGGYRLDRPAADISVAEIIAEIEGPIALTACVEGADYHCDVEAVCPMCGNWNTVNQAIQEALQRVTLADMAPASAIGMLPTREAEAFRRADEAT